MFSICGSAKENNVTGKKPKQDSIPVNILIINSFDAMSMQARKNKKELFAELADSLKQVLYSNIRFQNAANATILPVLLPETASSDSSIFLLMGNNEATKAIVIKKLDVYFNQTEVEVTGPKHDKTRKASYDICAAVTYGQYSRDTKLDESETIVCEHYTVRNVVSGFFAAGPDIVGKSKDAFRIMVKNGKRFLLGFSVN